jgi:hypothetical protein
MCLSSVVDDQEMHPFEFLFWGWVLKTVVCLLAHVCNLGWDVVVSIETPFGCLQQEAGLIWSSHLRLCSLF